MPNSRGYAFWTTAVNTPPDNPDFQSRAALCISATRHRTVCITITGMASRQDLQRFVEAQQSVYEQACAELAAGKKSSHWMWFVFPQLAGLGRSSMAVRFALASVSEAQAYWQHELLGPRLKQCIELVIASKGKTAFQIFGTPDDLKFRSCLTLFAHALPDEPLFKAALTKFFQGELDSKTVELFSREKL